MANSSTQSEVGKHPTQAAAKGRWRDILLAVGVEAKVLNGKHQPCPVCGGEDRFRYDDKRGDGGFMCSQCGPGTGFTLIQRIKRCDFKTAAHEVDMVLGTVPAAGTVPVRPRLLTTLADLRRLWATGRPITPEDPAGVYLAARRLTLDATCSVLRYVPALPHYPTRTVHPGMLAKFSDVIGLTKQLQRAYLTADGHRADLTPNRMFMPGDMPSGGAIRLGDPAETMGVAEGVETALAAAKRFGLPVWATASAAMMEKWEPPAEAKRIIVFGDNDSNYVGQIAAYTLGNRLLRGKREVEVRIPEQPNTDWADQQ